MIEIRKDAAKNRLYLKLGGFLKEENVASAGQRLLEMAKTMRSEFDIINDISEFKPGTTSVVEIIKKVQDDMIKLPVNRIVRVVGANALGKMQLSRASQQVGYKALAAATLQEAEALLDSETQ
jgi:hypothetical protein